MVVLGGRSECFLDRECLFAGARGGKYSPEDQITAKNPSHGQEINILGSKMIILGWHLMLFDVILC